MEVLAEDRLKKVVGHNILMGSQPLIDLIIGFPTLIQIETQCLFNSSPSVGSTSN